MVETQIKQTDEWSEEEQAKLEAKRRRWRRRKKYMMIYMAQRAMGDE